MFFFIHLNHRRMSDMIPLYFPFLTMWDVVASVWLSVRPDAAWWGTATRQTDDSRPSVWEDDEDAGSQFCAKQGHHCWVMMLYTCYCDCQKVVEESKRGMGWETMGSGGDTIGRGGATMGNGGGTTGSGGSTIGSSEGTLGRSGSTIGRGAGTIWSDRVTIGRWGTPGRVRIYREEGEVPWRVEEPLEAENQVIKQGYVWLSTWWVCDREEIG